MQTESVITDEALLAFRVWIGERCIQELERASAWLERLKRGQASQPAHEGAQDLANAYEAVAAFLDNDDTRELLLLTLTMLDAWRGEVIDLAAAQAGRAKQGGRLH